MGLWYRGYLSVVPIAVAARQIVNVSAMEGKFYRYKTPNHPHTNMAKVRVRVRGVRVRVRVRVSASVRMDEGG